MWHNHLFFQRAKTAENALRLGVGGKDREGEGVGKIWKKGGVGNIRGGYS